MADYIIPLLMFGIPGLILFLGGLNGLIKNSQIKKHGIKTVATIVDLEFYTERSDETGPITTTYPVVEFYDINRNKVVQELKEGDGLYTRGQKLAIIYMKINGNYHVVTNSKLFLVRFPLGMTIIGSVILVTIFLVLLNR